MIKLKIKFYIIVLCFIRDWYATVRPNSKLATDESFLKGVDTLREELLDEFKSL